MKEHITYQDKTLKKVFVTLLQKKKYSDITIKELTDLAGINRTTFYMFYSGKDDLAKTVCASFMDGCSELFKTSIANINTSQYENHILQAFDYFQANEDVIRGLWSIQEKSFSPYLIMQKSMENIINSQISSMRGLSLLNFELFANTYSASAMASIRYFLDHNCKYKKEIVHNIFILSTKGFYTLLKL